MGPPAGARMALSLVAQLALFALAYVFIAALVYEALEEAVGRWAALAAGVLWPLVVLGFPLFFALVAAGHLARRAWQEWRTARGR